MPDGVGLDLDLGTIWYATSAITNPTAVYIIDISGAIGSIDSVVSISIFEQVQFLFLPLFI